MKLRTIARIAITSSIVLLCTGFVMFSFFKISTAEEKTSFNLYSLIPSDASAIFETNDIVRLVQNIDDLDCSKDNRYLHISQLFSTFKSYLNSLLEETPHGLSKQMNKMLFSFHEPDNAFNQVLYCSLGSGDYQLLEKFVNKLSTGAYPSRSVEYKGEKIRIYPVSDGNFISCYITSKFLVLSYQKRLVEQVIDTYLSGNSLMKDPFFVAIRDNKKINAGNATVYTRMYSVDMGKGNKEGQTQTNVGNWMEFEVKMNETSIYFSGISQAQDTCQTFMNMLRRQQPVKGFPDGILPTSTFFFSRRSVSDLEAMLSFTTEQKYNQEHYSEYTKQRDEELSNYLKNNCGEYINTCLFHRTEEIPGPASVASIPLQDVVQAERLLQTLLEATPATLEAPHPALRTIHRIASKVYKFYALPPNTLFAQLTGITNPALSGYACFYNQHLLLAPDNASLAQYIRHMENAEIIDETPAYKEGISGLSDTYHFMLVANLEAMIAQPNSYTQLIPTLFFRNPEFFRHFILSAQFVCSEGIIYPNVVLSYKSE